LAVEADQFGPGHQICCSQDDFQPGGLGLADAVLHSGVLAMTQFQPAE
jgi:hypothetical protein